MHLSTKSTWHHHTVPFQSLKSCKISWGSCQHNATSAFTAVGSIYHYLHCKHFDITLTQPAFLVIQDMLSTLYLLKKKNKVSIWSGFELLTFDNQDLEQIFTLCFWAKDLLQSKPKQRISPIQDSHTQYQEYKNQCRLTVEEPNCENESTTSPMPFSERHQNLWR